MVRQKEPTERLAWEDRFSEPSPEELRGGLPHQTARLFDAACRELGALARASQEITWQGECWKWTLRFPLARRKRALQAVVIPNPEDLQIAMRMESEFVERLEDRRLKRAVRDGLELAASSFDTDWSVWTISSRPMLDEIIEIIREQVQYARSGTRN